MALNIAVQSIWFPCMSDYLQQVFPLPEQRARLVEYVLTGVAPLPKDGRAISEKVLLAEEKGQPDYYRAHLRLLRELTQPQLRGLHSSLLDLLNTFGVRSLLITLFRSESPFASKAYGCFYVARQATWFVQASEEQQAQAVASLQPGHAIFCAVRCHFYAVAVGGLQQQAPDLYNVRPASKTLTSEESKE